MFSDPKEFSGKNVYIDPTKIKVAPDPTDPQRRTVVIFPVELNRNDPSRRQTIWVKAARAREAQPEHRSVEDVLLETHDEMARKELKEPANIAKETDNSRAETEKSRAENEHETPSENQARENAERATEKTVEADARSAIVQVSLDTKAVFAKSEAEVVHTPMRY
jgi:hypothetical protein